MPVVTAIWSLMRAYQPAATRERKARRFGAFKPTYAPPSLFRAPKTDREAQRMYNHIRSVAFWLDAAPVLADLGLPFRAGLDDIISLVPLYGDLLSGILQLYQVFLCWLFGVPSVLCVQMIFNVILDVLVGIVPIIGDILDNLFKSNLRNLQLLEKYLLSDAGSQYHILLMPDSMVFLPEPKLAGTTPASAGSRMKAWFGMGGNPNEEVKEELEAERATGKVKRTRRMAKDEAGFSFRAYEEPYAYGSGPSARVSASTSTPTNQDF